jgi:hypothetical protein
MSDEITIASKISAQNGFGQNGFQGPSSDLPGQNTTSGLLPKVIVPNDATQQRTISKQPIAPAHGMRDRAAEAPATIPSKTSRRG